jgi:dTDP-4-amino-4,6-dideoxygalactose transaminase
MQIPFVDLKAQYLSIKPEIDQAIADVLSETAFIGGKYVKEFESKFAELYGVKHVVSCANGTDSLYIIMKMLGVGPGDEVITVANSWISSSETISQTGAKPVFVDCHADYFSSMDELSFEKAITPKTKAVIAVHLHGQILQIDTIKTICDKYKIALIEDCAQSHFSSLNGIRAGVTGIAGSFSFYPGKNLGAYGDAGCIITNDDELASKFKMYATHGSLKKHEHQIEGINSRLDGIQAAILLAKLPHILKWTEERIRVAHTYNELLAGNSNIITPLVRLNSMHSFHLYIIQTTKRDELKNFLGQKGIETALHYPTILPLLPAYKYLNNTESNFPNAINYQKNCLSLPIYPEITKEQIEYVSTCVNDFFLS